MAKRKTNIIPQMFDIRPVDEAGEMDVSKIESGRRVVKITPEVGVGKKEALKENKLVIQDVKAPEIADLEAFRFKKILDQEKRQYKPPEFIVPVSVDYRKEAKEFPVKLHIKKERSKPKEYPSIVSNFDRDWRGESTSDNFSGSGYDELVKDRQNCLSGSENASRKNLPPASRYGEDNKEFYQNYLDAEPSPILPRPKTGRGRKANPIDNFGLLAEIEEKREERDVYREEKKLFASNAGIRRPKFSFNFFPPKEILSFKTSAFSFAFFSLAIFLVLSSINFFYKGMKIKESALGGSQKALINLVSAKENIVNKDFKKASFEFQQAHEEFKAISDDLNGLGSIIVESTRYLPYLSKLSSGSHLSEAGKNISQVGVKMSETIDVLNEIKNPLDNKEETISFLNVFQKTDENLKEITVLLEDTEKHLAKVNIDDIPEPQRDKFLELRTKLPEINGYLSSYSKDSKIFTDILGGNGPRKYLFLFQNNQEMRPTGGFIGSYAIIDIFNGRVRNFFVDGIFNPDGQLLERVAPPVPIQKISVNWSLHDSNWFPDFPKSAEKATWFYEKTGGPTVDGVITMTPEVLGRLLEITGPIDLPEYGVTVDKDNFIESIQYEVEVDYDKELNQPKKILGDLVPKILDKMFNAKDFSDIAKAMNVLVGSLNEKHILIYSKNYDIEKTLSARGWTGEILSAEKDYLSVINTNINGFKTDGVISEKIFHTAEIQDDGSVVDTVTIRREHQGGDKDYDWWNKVNADYMRVYVPKGAKLLEVSGQTREFNSPPIDYDALGYKKDPQIKMEEDSIVVDEASGTRIYEEDGKTVFANWVYVSPKETAEIKYTYVLPFKVKLENNSQLLDTYSLLAQKQSGSVGSAFSSEIIYPDAYELIWQHPDGESFPRENYSAGKEMLKVRTELKTDKFIGAAFQRKKTNEKKTIINNR